MKDLQATPSVNPMKMPEGARIILPGNQVPSFRVQRAFDNGVANKFLINTWGGLGDQICAEPSLRFALKTFKDQSISLASRCPSLYAHLKFAEVFDTRVTLPKWEDYLAFETIQKPDTLLWEFCSHMLTHPVDFTSICMFRCQLPVADREIVLPDFPIENPMVKHVIDLGDRMVVIHAGKHWASKTFPKKWWDDVCDHFTYQGFTPVLIGQEVDENVGFVKIDNSVALDLRNQLSIKDFITLLKNCKYLFSNDSSPIHAASAGDAFIGVVASCKHPDFILHWRRGAFKWNAKNYGLDGVWNHIDYSPAQETAVEVESLPDGLMDAILPNPKDVAEDFARRRELQRKNRS